MSFRDLFSAIVHNNDSLSGAERLQYLKLALRGEPAQLIQSIAITDINYEEAWNILNDRYQNTREIVNAHIDRMIAQPSLQAESPSGLRKLADTTSECRRSLELLNVPVQHWDAIIINIITKKLDPESRRQWELSLTSETIPAYEELNKFMDQRARALATIETGRAKMVKQNFPFKNKQLVAVHHGSTPNLAIQACEICKRDHLIYKCEELRGISVAERHTLVKKLQLCFNCLRPQHDARDCKAGACRKCNRKHHTLLHFETEQTTNQNEDNNTVNIHIVDKHPINTFTTEGQKNFSQVLLTTAMIKIKGKDGQFVTCRALLDSASQASFITEECVQRLKLFKERTNVPVTGLNSSGLTTVKDYTNFTFTSMFNIEPKFTTDALIVPRITCNLPSMPIFQSWEHLRLLRLADPKFYEPSRIDVLLGADMFAILMRNGRISGPPGSPIAMETTLAWILAGRIQGKQNKIQVHHIHCDVDQSLRKFWEIEEVSSSLKTATPEEEKCEEHFASTYSTDETGRYVVQLPLREEENIPDAKWHHVSGKENPADCASRGTSAPELIAHNSWWYGPKWLMSLDNNQPNNTTVTTIEEQVILSEEKKSTVTMVENIDLSLLHKYSSLSRIQRITAWCMRFKFNAFSRTSQRRYGYLTIQELENALKIWIKKVQCLAFSEELRCISNNRSLPRNSRIIKLNPFIDAEGLLRVGGRLQNAKIAENRKHPFLLPRKSRLTTLIVEQAHVRNLHAGPQLLSSILNQNYWILCSRDVIRHTVHKCIVCHRQQARVAQQLMGNLPAPRVNTTRVFLHTGVDYAGPLLLRPMTKRSKIELRCYIAVFVCMTTRAIHLELVSDLTSAAFLAALKRFVARRGKPVEIYSDCGKNFVGANKEIRSFLRLIKSASHNEEIGRYLGEQGTNWNFNPPSGAHFGGLWEAGVKSIKYHLRRVVGNARLNFEEMYTVLVQIEACLNSRPLTAMSNDPSDLTALTPGHFLIGDSLLSIPEPDHTQTRLSQLTRWQLVQQVVQHFWRRWSAEYLSRLQQRLKWWAQKQNLKSGDLVLVKDEQQPPTRWKLGKILAVHPGEDGLVRVVTVRTASGEYKRSIVKIAKLPIDSD